MKLQNQKLNTLKKASYIFLTVLFMLTAKQGKSQISSFSQFYSSPMILSPSFVGMAEGSRVVMNFRDQWPNIPGVFVTYGFSFDHYISRLNSGIGILVVRDQAGVGNLSLTDIGIQYSYNVELNRTWSLRPGIHFLYSQRGIDFYKLIFGDQLPTDGQTPIASTTIEVPPVSRVGYIDFSSSMLLYSEKYWLGVNVDHLLQPDQSLMGIESRIPMKYSVFGGIKFRMSGNKRSQTEESISASFLYRATEGSSQLDFGAYWNYDPITIGLWFRGLPLFSGGGDTSYDKIDAIIVGLGYKVGSMRIAYSYDFTISKLLTATGGSHEVSLIYEFNQNVKIQRKRRRMVIPCPRF